MYYAGIGSRETPVELKETMKNLGACLSENGYILRSGNARGADKWFSDGCDKVNGNSEIFLPFKDFGGGHKHSILINNKNLLREATEIMKSIKPKSYTWNSKNTPYHRRNVFQILGVNLNTPVDFVICYTNTGSETEYDVINRHETSGTSMAIVLADRLDIPVINMYNDGWLYKLYKTYKRLG